MEVPLVGRYLGISLTTTILLTKTPQLLLSVSYSLYNSLYTSMLLTAEMNSNASHHIALRVTDPRGEQRSTHYLQLPYRYAIPLMIIFGTLHWVFSQSLFLVQISTFNINQQYTDVIQACGWSGSALATALGLGLPFNVSSWDVRQEGIYCWYANHEQL